MPQKTSYASGQTDRHARHNTSLSHLVSDIALFVLKRDVKHQLTNSQSYSSTFGIRVSAVI